MSPVRDFLQRFRPAGTPGKAAAAGVPADRARDLAAELEPVFSLLAGAEAERARILTEAGRDAGRIRDGARRRADDMVAAARQRAQAARADAAAAVLASGRGGRRRCASRGGAGGAGHPGACGVAGCPGMSAGPCGPC